MPGVRVPEVVTAGVGPDGDALIAVRPDGTPLAENGAVLDANAVRAFGSNSRSCTQAGSRTGGSISTVFGRTRITRELQ